MCQEWIIFCCKRVGAQRSLRFARWAILVVLGGLGTYFIDHGRRTGLHTHHPAPIQHYFMSLPSSTQVLPRPRQQRDLIPFWGSILSPFWGSDLSRLAGLGGWKILVLELISTDNTLFYHQRLVKMHSGCLLVSIQAIPSILKCPPPSHGPARGCNKK